MRPSPTAQTLAGLVKQFLRLTFDIREGEYGRALLMQLNIFLIILAHTMVKPVVNALFLSNVGIEHLPDVFVLVAVFAMAVSLFYARQLGRVQLNVIIRSSIGIAVTCLMVLGILLKLNLPGVWVYYISYIVVAIFGVVATSQVWILANLVFTAREASRLFGFIGAGAIAGGIAGGYLTSVLALLMNSENLIFLAALMFGACIPVSRKIWENNVQGLTHLQHRKRMTKLSDKPFTIIRSSKHLMYLASIIGVGVLVAKLVDYQFSALAAASIGDPDSLAAFFGFWFSTFNVVSLLIQLFLTRRIVGVYGVGTSLFVLPVALFLGAGALLAFPILSFGIFSKAADVTLKQSINKSATELLALPLPVGIKNQTKSYIDIFVDSAATGIGGLMLIFMVSGLDLSVRFISLLILPLLGLWVYFAIGVRREYFKTFREKIAPPSSSKNKLTDQSNNVISVLEGLRRALLSGTERQKIFVLNKVAEQHESRLFPEISPLIYDDSVRVRIAALEALYSFRGPDISHEVEKLLDDPDATVKIRAVEYLMANAEGSEITVIDRFLKHDDDVINGAALVGVAIESRNNPEMVKHFKLERRIQDKIQFVDIMDDASSKLLYQKHVLKAIGSANLSSFYPVIDQYLDHTDEVLVREAITAAGLTLHPRFVPRVCSFLTNADYREAAVNALVHGGNGILELFNQFAEDPAYPLETVRLFPKVAEKLGTQDAVDFLLRLYEHDDLTVQIEALRSLNNLKIEFPYLSVERKDIIKLIVKESKLYLDTIAAVFAEIKVQEEENAFQKPEVVEARESLINLLERRLDVILERIFRLLGLKYPPEEILPIYEGLQSDSRDLRINSVEYLDNFLNGHLKKIIVPIVETALLQSVTEQTIEALKIDVPDQHTCLEMLLKSRDIRIKLAVLYLIEQLQDVKYLPLMQSYSKHANAKIRDCARRAEQSILNA